jgi:hypothetical protein
VAAVLLAAALSGCGGAAGNSGGPSKADGTAHPSASGAVRVAARGGTVGATGSACELPVRFDVAAHWKPKSIDAGATASKSADRPHGDHGGAVADALLHQGPVTAACEIDAKPAGDIGFLRVWTGRPGDTDARGVLRAFVAAEDNVSEERYRTFTAGGLSGVEVEYLYTSKVLDETKKECAFAVVTPHGPVVVHLGGPDTEEHEAMLPAYELAKRTLRLN